MSVIAIVGAGPGLGAKAAERFGREGFTVALVARDGDKLASIEQALVAEGVTARSYVADVSDRSALTSALDRAVEGLGPIDVLQYSPVPSSRLLRRGPRHQVEDLQAATEFSILGPAVAIGQVLPGMIERGSGTVRLINGSSAVTPNGNVAGTSVAFAGESAYGAMLHDAAATKGVQVRQLIVRRAIGGDDPLYEPAVLAEELWELHATPGPFRVTVGEPPP